MQVHDFNPGIAPNGVFWILQIPDDAVVISGDTLTIHVKNLSVADEIAFPGPTRTPATVTFDITYTKSGEARRVRPTSDDPLSGFTWAGKMSPATNSGTFSVAYNDGSFSAKGSFSSSGNFGEMGTERNGTFLEDGETADDAEVELGSLQPGPSGSAMTTAGGIERPEHQWRSPRLKAQGR